MQKIATALRQAVSSGLSIKEMKDLNKKLSLPEQREQMLEILQDTDKPNAGSQLMWLAMAKLGLTDWVPQETEAQLELVKNKIQSLVQAMDIDPAVGTRAVAYATDNWKSYFKTYMAKDVASLQSK